MDNSDILSNDNWIKEPPKYTTFRVNTLKHFNKKNLENILQMQAKELQSSEIPNFYLLRPDCLVLEQWPKNISLEKTGKEVIVDALCGAAVLRGAHVFAPGVLGLPTTYRLGDRVDIYGDIEGQCKRGLKVEYNGKKIYVGTGILKMLRHDLFDKGVQTSGVAVHTLFPVSRLPVVNETIGSKGEILLQNLPSIVCGWVVNARPNDYILDMCSAPGNKTTHLAEMAQNQIKIIAIDKTRQKVETIRRNCQTQAVTCVEIFNYDSTKCYLANSKCADAGPPFPANCFDKVLLDAPCSGLGQRPQLVNKITPKMLQSYKFVQRKLFEAAANVLKFGGTLVYSTCTTTVEENEKMVSWVLENFPYLKLTPAEPLLGGPGLSNCGLSDEQRIMVQRFGPENDPLRFVDPVFRDTIGFFIAKFVKI